MSKFETIILGLLGLLAFWVFFGLPIYHDPPHDIKFPDMLVALFTATLVISTVVIAVRQFKDTEILQRAYISVEPDGILNSRGAYVGHVIFHNVGHLPAT